MQRKKKYNVLVCPLDWGIGHATRCVPIIKELSTQGYNVFIGADKRPLDFLKNEFQNLKFVSFPGTNISYPANDSHHYKLLNEISSFTPFLVHL